MTNPNQEPAANEGPEGLIFLPETIKDLRNYQLGLMLGRVARGSSLAEVESLYNAAETQIRRKEALLNHAGHIAIASGI